jgi:hypothetical protein
MTSLFRESYLNALTSGAHLLLLFIGFQTGSRNAWLATLGAVGLISIFAWAGNFRRHRLMGDTPTSRVASAAQGYVELQGTAQYAPGSQPLSKLTALPCVWYRYVVERKDSNDKWERLDAGASSDTFLLRDGTGDCVMDPDGAEIHTRHRQRWTRGDYRYTEWVLLPNDPLYAIGEFSTLNPAATPLSQSRDIGALLAEWKRNRPRLLERFDLNKDGEIDLREWSLARAEARREVRRRHDEIRQLTSAIHIMRAPKDGRLYLLANLDPDKLSRRHRIWGMVHLAILLAAGAGMAYVWSASGI